MTFDLQRSFKKASCLLTMYLGLYDLGYQTSPSCYDHFLVTDTYFLPLFTNLICEGLRFFAVTDD